MNKKLEDTTEHIGIIEIITPIMWLIILYISFFDGFWQLIPIVALVFFAVIFAVIEVFRNTLPEKYSKRPFQARAWKRDFPDANNDDIRQFLMLLVDIFSFDEKEKLQFNPSDTILPRSAWGNYFLFHKVKHK